MPRNLVGPWHCDASSGGILSRRQGDPSLDLMSQCRSRFMSWWRVTVSVHRKPHPPPHTLAPLQALPLSPVSEALGQFQVG